MTAGETTLEVGMQAPKFTAFDSAGAEYDLDGMNSDGKHVILYFYPKDNTPGCTVQACDFRDDMSNLSNSDYIVLGVSKDSAKSHDKFISNHGLNFPILMDEELKLHHSFGVWREKMNYGKTYMGTSRSTFVVNPDGELIWVGYNVRAKGHVSKLMRELGLL
ncbi:MAG: peroxiredoxin [Candidatus Poseidoniaceae archaeon]|jgi:peroxiredoxin Q/BCP|nr:peroxiredoxin [Candidatus Poseidoniaceae archaeon]MDP7202784.1 peroxiredoxin [Candidatus Poseidoniaceae archaeon]